MPVKIHLTKPKPDMFGDTEVRNAVRDAIGKAVMTKNDFGGLPEWGERPWPNILLEFESEEEAAAMMTALARAST